MRGLNLTLEDVEAHNKRVRASRAGQAISLPSPVQKTQPQGKRRGEMNKLETRFVAEELEPSKLAGVITDYKYEGLKFRLAQGSWYTPDFVAWYSGRDIRQTVFEVKGFLREAAMVRIKVAAELYPAFQFVMVFRLKGGGWTYKWF